MGINIDDLLNRIKELAETTPFSPEAIRAYSLRNLHLNRMQTQIYIDTINYRLENSLFLRWYWRRKLKKEQIRLNGIESAIWSYDQN